MNARNKKHDVDILLKKALNSSETPDAKLIQKLKYELIKEDAILKKPTIRRSFSVTAATIAVLLLTTTTAFATWHFLKPSELATEFSNHTLSAAFESETAVNINRTVTSGNYVFTLLAVVMGKDITDYPYYSATVQSERTYAVVAIQNADGTPMPHTSDDEYGSTNFFTSPLIKGLEPWRYNASTMNGGYTETVVDGTMYRLLECDDIAMFSDRGLYFAINTGWFFQLNAYIWDEQTGEIKANPNFDGSSAVFDLPLDTSLADPERAEQYLSSLFQEPDDDVEDENENRNEYESHEDLWSDIGSGNPVPVELQKMAEMEAEFQRRRAENGDDGVTQLITFE